MGAKLAKWITVVACCAIGTGCLMPGGGGGGDGSGSSNTGGGGGEGGDGAGGSDLTATTCAPCVQGQMTVGGSCEITAALCYEDPACTAWWECLDSCAVTNWTGTCTAACSMAHPTAEVMGYSLLNCVCAPCYADPDCAPLCG